MDDMKPQKWQYEKIKSGKSAPEEMGKLFASSVHMVSVILLNGRFFPKDMHLAFFIGIIAGYLILPPLLSNDPATEKLVKKEVFKSNVLITGASQGIGEELAYAFSKRGANLVITARSVEKLTNVSSNCIHLGARSVKVIPADMALSEDRENVHELVQMRFGGKLDFVILNHATQLQASNWKGSKANMSSLRDVMGVNYFAYVHLASSFLAQLEHNGGRLVIVSSFVGKVSFPFYAPYVSSKFALQGFFGSLRHELRMRGSPASVTLAVLGRIDTATQRKSLATGGFVRHGNLPAGSSAQKTAEAILEGAVLRKKEVYYPILRPLVAVANIPILSDILDLFIGYQMERTSDF